MTQRFTVSFDKDAVGLQGQSFAPVYLAQNANLSEELDIHNSPILFGCRTGICGTCLVRAVQAHDKENQSDPIGEDEQEMLELYAPKNGEARLACQIRLQCELTLFPLSRSVPGTVNKA
jgi:ferredoxin